MRRENKFVRNTVLVLGMAFGLSTAARVNSATLENCIGFGTFLLPQAEVATETILLECKTHLDKMPMGEQLTLKGNYEYLKGNLSKADEYWSKAAKKGSSAALANQGLMYYTKQVEIITTNAIQVRLMLPTSLKLNMKALDEGSPEAYGNLIYMYRSDLTKDPDFNSDKDASTIYKALKSKKNLEPAAGYISHILRMHSADLLDDGEEYQALEMGYTAAARAGMFSRSPGSGKGDKLPSKKIEQIAEILAIQIREAHYRNLLESRDKGEDLRGNSVKRLDQLSRSSYPDIAELASDMSAEFSKIISKSEYDRKWGSRFFKYAAINYLFDGGLNLDELIEAARSPLEGK